MAEATDQLALTKSLKESGYSASVITTFNAYLPFYEEVVLRRLVAAGCTHNLVLMDARQCAGALGSDSTRPRRAGVDYTLVPIRSPGAFHPKILLRLGKRKGSLFIGSHNLTVAGFGMNDELTNRFDYDPKTAKASLAPFAAVVKLIRDFVGDGPREILDGLDAALEAAPWLRGVHAVPDDVAVLGSTSTGASLWDQLREVLPDRIDRALVLSPFFDSKLELIGRVSSDLSPKEVTVALDPLTAHIEHIAARAKKEVRFVDARGRIEGVGRREGIIPYLHAKAMVLQSDAHAFLVTGSANASSAAFLAPRRRSNTEAIVVRRLEVDSPLLGELGLSQLFDAPEVTEAAWDEVARRLKDDSRDPAEVTPSAAVAIVVERGLRLDVAISADATIDAIDAAGNVVGSAFAIDHGPPALLGCDEDVVESAALLRINEGTALRWAIIHRPARIAENYASDTRRALRKALGSLDEDPSQLELLLRLSEKVIFDDDGVLEKSDAQLRRGRSMPPGASEPPPDTSLAVDAGGRRAGRRRRSIASGDITVLLDALIHRLGQGLEQAVGQAPARPNEEELVGADDDTDELPPEQPNFERLGKACRRKTRNLLKRMRKQLKLVVAEGTPRRAIIQLAAVLGILRALRGVELRDEWRRSGYRLIHEEAMADFFWNACPILCVGDEGLAPAALRSMEGEAFDELSVTLGMFVWLAWECDVDLGLASQKQGKVGVEEELWGWVQCLAYLAPFAANDARAEEIATESVRRSPKRRVDEDAWLSRHLRFLSDVGALDEDPEAAAVLQRSPRPGDMIRLSARFDPRLRVVLEVADGERGKIVTVLDEHVEAGERKFLADRVQVVAAANHRRKEAM